MTEYELIALMRETDTTIAQNFEFFISATFAVIVVSYAVGDKLKALPRIVITILYLGSVVMLFTKYQNLLGQVNFMVASLSEVGSDFPATLKVPLASWLRQFIMIFGAFAAVFTIFKPVLSAHDKNDDTETRDDDT